MATIANLIVNVGADVSGLKKSADEINGQIDGLTGTVGRVGKAIVGAFSVGQIVDFVSTTTAAFAEEEAALQRLTTALQAQGTFTPELTAQYAALASQFQQTTSFADDLILGMQGLLVQVGNVAPEQMEAALTAATNLASGLGVDLRTATMLVAKAFEGETGTLKRYGIVIDETALKSDGAGAVMAAINEKFGGQAQAELDTYAGKMKQVGNQMSDAQERAGGLIAAGLTPLLDLFTKLPAPMQTTVGVVQALSPDLQTLTLGVMALGGPGKALALLTGAWGSMATFVTGSILPLISSALPLAFKALAALFSMPAGLVIAGILAVVAIWRNWDTIGPMVKAVYDAVKTWLVDKFQAIVDRIKGKVDAVTGFFKGMYDKVVGHSYVPDMIREIGGQFGRLRDQMVAPAAEATSGVDGLFGGLLSNLRSKLPSGFGEIFDVAMGKAGDFLAKLGIKFGPEGETNTLFGGLLSGLLEKLPPGFGEIFGGVLGKAGEFLGTFTGSFRDTFKALFGDEGGGGVLQDIVGKGLRGLGDLLFPGFGDLLASLAPVISAGLQILARIFESFFSWVWSTLRRVFSSLNFSSGGSGPFGNLPPIGSNIPGWSSGPAGGGGAPPPWDPPDAFAMADGGMGRVTRPTLFLAGEAGAEDFAFSGGGRRFGGGDGGVIVNVNAQGAFFDTPASRQRLSEMVGKSVMEELRRAKRLNAA